MILHPVWTEILLSLCYGCDFTVSNPYLFFVCALHYISHYSVGHFRVFYKCLQARISLIGWAETDSYAYLPNCPQFPETRESVLCQLTCVHLWDTRENPVSGKTKWVRRTWLILLWTHLNSLLTHSEKSGGSEGEVALFHFSVLAGEPNELANTEQEIISDSNDESGSNVFPDLELGKDDLCRD